MKPDGFSIREVVDSDRDWILKITREEWGDNFVAVHDQTFYPHQLAGFIAEDGEGAKVGLITYTAAGEYLEIVTLNSIKKKAGIGSALIEALEKEAKSHGALNIRVTTTNDNQRAIDFYHHRGFKLVNIRKGAVNQARKIKPSLPAFSADGLPITDELDFVLSLE